MIARPVLVFLLVMNLGAAAWWGLHRPRAARAEPEPSLPALEIATDVGERAAVSDSASAVPASRPGPAGDATTSCVLLGAFAEARDVQRALGSLRAGNVAAVAVTRFRSPRGFNVLIPPLSTPEAAEATQARLATAGFTDQFLIREGAQANGIALGRFGSETGARALVARLKAAGFEAQLAPVGATTTELWIQARAEGQNADALRALAGSRQARPVACEG